MQSANAMPRLSRNNSADFALRYARALLNSLGLNTQLHGRADHPAIAWRRSGLMALTGPSEGQALMCPSPLASAADGALLALRTLSATDPSPHAIGLSAIGLPANGSMLLGERARLRGLTRGGRISPNGSCRLLACHDGTIALNLARPDDWDLLPALFERIVAEDWDDVVQAAAACRVEALTARAASMGMAVAAVSPPRRTTGWFALRSSGQAFRRLQPHPRVIDFSSLWAGPLAGGLLAALGADVVKVESTNRPDGSRLGDPKFFQLLNDTKQHLALDFADKAALAELVAGADIVIEGSRPRALRQLGIHAETFAARGGLWISITGHGRDGPAADRVGFGDDAAVAGGLAWAMARAWGNPLFAGDAVADPLTGLHAALVGWALWSQGRSGIVELSLAGTVGHILGTAGGGMADTATLATWQALAEADSAPLYPLRPC